MAPRRVLAHSVGIGSTGHESQERKGETARMSTSETATTPVQPQTPPKPLYTSAGTKWQKVPVKPAARVWTEAMPSGREEQVAFFRREGFLILRGVADKDELAELDREVARMVAAHRSLPR